MKAGWHSGALGTLCKVRRGTTITQKEAVVGSVPVVAGGLAPTYTHNVANRPAGTITVSASGANAGFVNRYDEPIFASDCSTINSIDEDRLSGEFVFRFLQSRQDYINSGLRRGSAQPHVYASDLASIEIPIPPHDEQRRIVAVLEKAFAGIAIATANAQKNLTNARALFESASHSIFVNQGEGWDEKALGDVCRFVGGSQPPKAVFSPTPSDKNVRLIQIRDYKSDNYIVYIPKNLARRFCEKDDVMIGRYGPPLFQILRGIEGAYNVALMKAAPNEKVISKDYLYYFLRNRDLLQYIIAASARAAGQIGLTKETIEPYPIPFPDLEKQGVVVKRLMDIEDATRQLAAVEKQKLAAVAELKQSLLQKAFAGELT